MFDQFHRFAKLFVLRNFLFSFHRRRLSEVCLWNMIYLWGFRETTLWLYLGLFFTSNRFSLLKEQLFVGIFSWLSNSLIHFENNPWWFLFERKASYEETKDKNYMEILLLKRIKKRFRATFEKFKRAFTHRACLNE